MESISHTWNNPDAGIHPLPADPKEIAASLRAARSCMNLFPYLGIRFGDRGDAFARTDSGYLATLVQNSQEYVFEQTQWLARVLANRGMPRWLMEVHLEILAEELNTAVPEGKLSYGKLLNASVKLRSDRQSIIPQDAFERTSTQFSEQSGNLIENFGGLVVSAVCDASYGLTVAVPSLVDWASDKDCFSNNWRTALADLLEHSRLAANPSPSCP